MIDKLEETVHDNEAKTPGVNIPETHVLTHRRITIYLVWNLSDLNKAHIYKIPYRDNLRHEIEILISFKYSNFFWAKLIHRRLLQ